MNTRVWHYVYTTDRPNCHTDIQTGMGIDTVKYIVLQILYFLGLIVIGKYFYIWAPSSEFVSSSIPSWQISTAHAQPFRRTRVLAFCPKVPLDSLLVWASSEGSGETARMRRLAWTVAARIGDAVHISFLLRNDIHHPSIMLYPYKINNIAFRITVSNTCMYLYRPV